MKKKKHLKQTKSKNYNRSGAYCNHCGGALKLSEGYVSCLMCGRDGNHFCDNCMTATNLTMKSA